MLRNWKHTINFKYFWDDDEISITEKGRLASKELNKLEKHFPNDYELEDAIDNFCDVSEISEFDSVLSNLYDWADYNSVWIATCF